MIKDINLNNMTTRELQKESARALAVLNLNNNEMSVLNKQAYHSSHDFYLAAIKKYIAIYGDLPSKIGPGAEIKLIYDD